MTLGIAIFISCAAAVFAKIALHECGHFLAGLIAGVPAGEMRIRLLVFPQHVALRDGQDWLSPHDQRYVPRSLAMIKGRKGMIGYVSGGLLVETVVFFAFVWIGGSIGIERLWLLPLTIALASQPALYLIVDVLASVRAKRALGDFSALWLLSPVSAVCITLFVVISHAGIFVYVLQNA